jgi:molybdopterin molybdotransferase
MSTALPSYEEAAALVAEYAAQLRGLHRAAERVDAGRAHGRVVAHPLRADRDQPPFTRSTRDGFACRAAEAARHMPLAVAGSTRAGGVPEGPLPVESAWEIMTGAQVPSGADAVMMVEHVEAGAGEVRLLPPRSLKPGENIVAQGAQAHKGDELLPAGTVIGPAQVALAAACGHAGLEVFLRPRVAILATGDELVAVRSIPAAGQIRNSNGPMLAAMVAAAGGEPWMLPVASDHAETLDAAIAEAAEADLLLITGGVSAGKFDLVEPALERAGGRFFFTGVRIQPGKPTVFGELPRKSSADNATRRMPCFGLAGNPVSSAVTFLLFAQPVLAALAGSGEPGPRFAMAKLAPPVERNVKSGLTRFLPAHCGFNAPGGEPEVRLVPWHGSGDVTALARSNCFLVVPEEAHRLRAGSMVRILLL